MRSIIERRGLHWSAWPSLALGPAPPLQSRDAAIRLMLVRTPRPAPILLRFSQWKYRF